MVTILSLKKLLKSKRVPVSYGGTVLSFGSTGDAVRTIQQQLNAISNNFPVIQKLPVTGYFGELTQNAVKLFKAFLVCLQMALLISLHGTLYPIFLFQ